MNKPTFSKIQERLTYGLFLNLPTSTTEGDLNKQSLSDLANRIADLITYFAYPVALAGILYCAYLLITSNGKPDVYEKAKKNIVFIITGTFLIVFALAIVRLATSVLTIP